MKKKRTIKKPAKKGKIPRSKIKKAVAAAKKKAKAAKKKAKKGEIIAWTVKMVDDPELIAIATLLENLLPLDQAVRIRILSYLNSRFTSRDDMQFTWNGIEWKAKE